LRSFLFTRASVDREIVINYDVCISLACVLCIADANECSVTSLTQLEVLVPITVLGDLVLEAVLCYVTSINGGIGKFDFQLLTLVINVTIGRLQARY
jgi:hypothetical protein